MGHYKSNLRDLEFNLFEVLKIQKLLEAGKFGDLDEDTARGILAEVKALAEGPAAEAFADTDRNPPLCSTPPRPTRSRSPPKDSRRRSARGGTPATGPWASPPRRSAAPTPSLAAVGRERDDARRTAGRVHVRRGPPAFAGVLFENGTDEQKQWAATCVERGWGSTMVLTEPDAGSDVGAGRTKAVQQDDGSWHIEGVKRFITSADSDDLFENIFHLVLARPEGGKPGTKGLSLFFVPKFHFDFEKNELGERNGVFVTNVEHKMGLKASATCEVTFGGHGVPAKGWLVGEVHNGIAQMFDVIEHARMMVGTKAISTLSTGYLNALDYAKERVQAPTSRRWPTRPRRA